MMEYYRLIDDVNITGRWHIGDIVNVASGNWIDPRHGLSVSQEMKLEATISQNGVPLDFFLSSFAVPIATARLASAIHAVAGFDLQRIPVAIDGHRDFEVLNSTRVVACLDETRSNFTKWTATDHRSDLAGQYRMVIGLRLKRETIPDDAHFFRIKDWTVALVVSERVKTVMENMGCHGAKFQNIS